LSSAGIVIEGNDFVYLENIAETPEEISSVSSTATSNFGTLSVDELKAKLQEALADESYEKAAKIRDELNRRKAS
ncbi:MAG TPA: UvrB/UvrC motif-containing protein, partial [Mucilaginibacter sp.]